MLGNIAQSIGSDFGSKTRTLFSKLQNAHVSPLYSKTIIEDISGHIDLFRKLEDAISSLRIVSFQGYWYLFGEELLQSALKTFYFKDIGSLNISDETFEMRDDAVKALDNALNVWFEPDKEPFEVLLRASPVIAKYFSRRPLSRTQRIVKTHDDGSIDITLLVTSDNELLHEVKQWMPELTILGPKHLALKAKSIAEVFLESQVGHLIG